MNNKTLENQCQTIETLKMYLQEKGKNHNCYKCYSSLKRIADIRDSKALYLSNGESWNDINDRNGFNSDSDTLKNFGKCFSFSQDENVAMWMLYGGIDKASGMIDFTKKGINAILDIPSLSVGYFNKSNVFVSLFELNKKDFNICITDIVYYKKNGNAYYINRSDESFPNLSEDIFAKLNGCKKAYPWKYENECRLIVSINKSFINQECKIVKINLENLDLGKSFVRIYRGPNYPLKDVQNSLPSKLDNTIDWSLCDGKTCINNRQGEE